MNTDEKHVKQNCSEENQIDGMDAEEMKEALTKIAQEVQRYCSGDSADELLDQKEVFKSKLEKKRKQIKLLRENLHTACMVAKTLTASKEVECLTLNKHLVDVRNEALSLQKQNAGSLDTIQKLTAENNILTAKLQHLKNFIELGYKELQVLRKQPEKDMPTELKLKEIVVFCGQYYADYLNEHDARMQLEQKNRFLTNKLSLMERDLQSVKQELQNSLQSHKSRCSSPNIKGRPINYVNSELNVWHQQQISIDSIMEVKNSASSRDFESEDRTLDLTSHMSLVKKLLSDQDTILADLKQLSQEIQCMNS